MTYSRRIRLAPIWVAIALALAIVLLAFAVVPAFADVDTVSQANCAESDNSGAKSDGSRAAPGRPAGIIPENAPGRLDSAGDPTSLPNNGGGDGDPECDVPQEVRQGTP